MGPAPLFLLAALPLLAQSEDAQLKTLREFLVPLRAHAFENLETRGATPQLTLVKHQLRDWIELRLIGLTLKDDPAELARMLNAELKQAKLFCDFTSDETRCPDDSGLGFLWEIKLQRPTMDSLVVETAVGIGVCGFDESAYAYRWTGSRWERFWQSEQNDYTKQNYRPQTLLAVLISPKNPDRIAGKSQHLVITLGRNPWCTSNWQPIYYRVWQNSSSYKQTKRLLDETDVAFGDLRGSSDAPNDLVIEYTVRSIDGLMRQEIRHYVVGQNKIQRVDPVALGPRDFVDNWVGHPWKEISRWTEPSARTALEKWRQKRNGLVSGEFMYPTFHCQTMPDLWQVGIDFDEPEYFLIRWRPPYHFTMVDVSDHPWPDCTEEDRRADEPPPLFPPR